MQLTLILFPIALAIYGAIIYLFVLLVKALRKYIKSKDVREEKKAVCRSLGEALKTHRTEKQMTQEFVAETLGVSRQAVSKWENGTSDPSTSNLCALAKLYVYGDNVIEKHGINRDSTGDREKTRYLCGKQGIFTRDRALIRPGFIRQLETRASTRSASFFHALGSPGRPHNGGGEAGAYRTRNGAKPLKQGHLRAKRGPLGPSRKSQQQTKRTGFAAHGHSIAETAPEGKRASCANGALIRA